MHLDSHPPAIKAGGFLIITMKPMKPILKSAATSLILMIAMVLSASPGSAEPQGLKGSYVGISNDGSTISNDILNPFENLLGIGSNSSDERIGSMYQGRIDLPNLPISVRGAAFLSDKGRVVEPTITYDVPVASNTNIYLGGGYTFVNNEEITTPLGNQNSAVLTAGVEAAVNDYTIIYGSGRLSLSDENNDTSPVKLQFGAGYRF